MAKVHHRPDTHDAIRDDLIETPVHVPESEEVRAHGRRREAVGSGRERIRWLRWMVAALLIVAAGVVAIVIGTRGSDTDVAGVDTTAVADWARENDLTGLSPANLRPVADITTDIATDIADPAGPLGPGGNSLGMPVTEIAVSDTTSVTDWARENDLTGLSPANLQPVADPVGIDTTSIADWARENDLTGLSPANLRPIAD